MNTQTAIEVKDQNEVTAKDTTARRFAYPSESIEQQCEELAGKIWEIETVGVQFLIRCRLEQGKMLNAVRKILPFGQFGPWLAWKFPDWSEPATRRWRVMAERVEKAPELLSDLLNFKSISAAEEYPALSPKARKRVIEQGAWTWTEFRAIQWDETMRGVLADQNVKKNERFGDVLHAIEEAKSDPVLEGVRTQLYQENREYFAELSSRTPPEVDVEVGIKWKPPRPNKTPSARLVEEDDSTLWLCEYDPASGQFLPVSQVVSRIEVTGADGDNITLAVFPAATNGAATQSIQRAGIDAFASKVNATRIQEIYGEVL